MCLQKRCFVVRDTREEAFSSFCWTQSLTDELKSIDHGFLNKIDTNKE